GQSVRPTGRGTVLSRGPKRTLEMRRFGGSGGRHAADKKWVSSHMHQECALDQGALTIATKTFEGSISGRRPPLIRPLRMLVWTRQISGFRWSTGTTSR